MEWKRRFHSPSQKKRYKDNAKSYSKLIQCTDDTLLESIEAAGGPKNSVWLMKQWLRLNYAEVTAEDSLMDLGKELRELHPGDYKEAFLYLGQYKYNSKISRLNYCPKSDFKRHLGQ